MTQPQGQYPGQFDPQKSGPIQQQPAQQPYSFPQAAYSQYPQPQPQGQWNPNGVYGGAPEKKTAMPVWGWMVIGVLGLIVVIQAGIIVSRGNPTEVANTVPTSAAQTTVARAGGSTVATPVAQSVSNPNGKEVGVRVEGAGQELIGKGGTYNDLKMVITKVERFSQLHDSGKTVKPQGVFLVISYDLENIGSEPHSFISFSIVDGKNRSFSSSGGIDAVSALVFNGGYRSDLNIQPTYKGKSYSVFDIPADASNLTLKVGF